MAEVVLIHGIAQEQYGADVLEAQWLPSLASGVRVAGFTDLADRLWRARGPERAIEARMAFYGDLFLKKDEQGGGDLEGFDASLVDALAEEWLERAATRSAREKDRRAANRDLADLRGEVGDEQQGVRSLGRHLTSRVARVRFFARIGAAFAEKFIVKALAQVSTYLSNDEIRSTAQERALNLIGPDTRVIVGHSLGSVVAYEVCCQLTRPLPLLVTVGSPLGLQTIIYQQLRPQPPIFPSLVQRWANVADRNDLVAAEPDLTSFFGNGIPEGARFEGAYTVDNGAQPHEAGFYLAKSEVGGPVGEALAER